MKGHFYTILSTLFFCDGGRGGGVEIKYPDDEGPDSQNLIELGNLNLFYWTPNLKNQNTEEMGGLEWEAAPQSQECNS